MKNKTLQFLFLLLFTLSWSCKNDTKFESGVQDNGYERKRIKSEGEVLFRENCAMCHHRLLRDMLTASPLGNITMFRDSVYLLNVTKNFMKEIAKGNEVAICQWNKNSKLAMTEFEWLTDAQVFEIYRFITDESKRLNITKEEMRATYECK